MEDQRQRVMDRAWKLQAEREKAEDQARVRAEIGRASAEVGLDTELIGEAERQLAREDAAARTRMRTRGVIAAGVFFIAAGAALLLWPAPSFSDDFSGAANRWVLDKSRGTEAGVDYVTEEGRGSVARVRVDKFAPLPDGTYQVNLDRTGVVSAKGLDVAAFDVRGDGLTVTRLYLEAGDERWRSPPLTITPEWTTHELPLSAFDHQIRQGGTWQTGGAADPGEVTTLSLKLGHYMNEADAHGEVRFDNLRLE